MYELTIKHIGHNNSRWLADILSRAIDTDKLVEDDRIMTQDQANELFSLVTLHSVRNLEKLLT